MIICPNRFIQALRFALRRSFALVLFGIAASALGAEYYSNTLRPFCVIRKGIKFGLGVSANSSMGSKAPNAKAYVYMAPEVEPHTDWVRLLLGAYLEPWEPIEQDITYIFQTPYGEIWGYHYNRLSGTGNGPVYKNSNGVWTDVSGAPYWRSAIYFNEKHMLVYSDTGLFLRNDDLWSAYDNPDYPLNTYPNRFSHDNKGLFVGTDCSVVVLDILNNIATQYTPPYPLVFESATCDRDGILWVSGKRVDEEHYPTYNYGYPVLLQLSEAGYSIAKESKYPFAGSSALYASPTGLVIYSGVWDPSEQPSSTISVFYERSDSGWEAFLDTKKIYKSNYLPLYENRGGTIWMESILYRTESLSDGGQIVKESGSLFLCQDEMVNPIISGPENIAGHWPPLHEPSYPIETTGMMGSTIYLSEKDSECLYIGADSGKVTKWDLSEYLDGMGKIKFVDSSGVIYISQPNGFAMINTLGKGTLIIGDDGHTCCYDPDDIGLCDGGCPDAGDTSDPAEGEFSSRLWSTIVSCESCGESGTTGVSLNVKLPSEMFLVLDFDVQDDDTDSTDGDAGATLAPEGATYDAYLALVTPWQSVHFVESLPMHFSNAPEPTPLVSSWTPFDIDDATLLQIQLNEGLSSGTYTWHFVLVESGAALADADNWISHSTSTWNIQGD